MVDMNDSMSWVEGFKCYDQLRAIDDNKDFRSLGQGSRCYE